MALNAAAAMTALIPCTTWHCAKRELRGRHSSAVALSGEVDGGRGAARGRRVLARPRRRSALGVRARGRRAERLSVADDPRALGHVALRPVVHRPEPPGRVT